MYLISAYFDDKTEKRIQKYIDAVAARTGCGFMVDNNIPPHITLAQYAGSAPGRGCGAGDGGEVRGSFIAERIEERIDELIRAGKIGSGSIDVVSFGVFKPRVMFLTPVLNEYLFNISLALNEALNKNTPKRSKMERGKIQKDNYTPFNWLPHITIARGLSEPQMRQAFSCMQADFEIFSARIERIGLAESRPYTDIKVWELHQQSI